MIERLVEQIESRFDELSQQMSDPDVIGDQRRYAEVGRAYRALEPAHGLAQEWRRATDDAAGARELLAEDGDDPELREMLRGSEERLAELEEEIRLSMVEPDPNDDKDVIVEIRPGTGGEEAGLFAADLYRMLSRYADRRGFKQEPLEIGDGHYTFAVKGRGAYSVFKYEGGTHRVQRVPETESQGRIHTSTATIAVLPEAEEVEVQIDPGDLQIDVYRSSGPGGQSVNTTDSAVRITHKPTGSGGLDAGREVAAAEPRPGHARAARAAARARAGGPAGRGGGAAARPGRLGRARGEDPHLQLPPGPGDRPSRRADQGQPAGGAGRRARRVHRGARGRGQATEARSLGGVTARDALGAALDALTAAGCETPRLDAELLIADALGVSRADLAMDPELPVSGRAARLIGERVRRRVAREPVAYILGVKGFRRLMLQVDGRVLIPRPETELLVEVALELPAGSRVHDVGTGSGAVALALIDERPDLVVSASDASASAVEVARANGLDAVVHRGLPAGEYDMVVANLPYVREDEWEGLAPEIRLWEPREALVSGVDGLDAIRSLVAQAPAGVRLALEHAPAQTEAIRELLRSPRVHSDLAGLPRVTVGDSGLTP